MAKGKDDIVRSTKVSIKFTNDGKLKDLKTVIVEYNRLLNIFIEYYWPMATSKLPTYCSASDYNKEQFKSPLSAYLKQCCGKQALGIIRGTVKKQQKRLYRYEKLVEEKKFKQARKLKRYIDKVAISMPVMEELVPMEIGSNPTVIKIDLDNSTSFDGWAHG
jgi:hypothetical protein